MTGEFFMRLPRASSLPARNANASLARTLLLVAGGSLLLAASGWVHVPMWPVPMTLQTLAVLMIGGAYGGRLAGATLAAYLVEGAVGLPVFAGGHTLLTAGPTIGYLIGFLWAAVAVGALIDRGWGRRPVLLALALLLGEVLIYLPGLAWLNATYAHDWAATLSAGLLPFIPGDAVKFVLAVLLLSVLRIRRAN
jgi:biotin transport system substrate-specific component